MLNHAAPNAKKTFVNPNSFIDHDCDEAQENNEHDSDNDEDYEVMNMTLIMMNMIMMYL